ncbi:DUF3426 domain-containing protein [Luteimonas panaciterrae]|uniref:DUF3426 domain-containing protein n=1 Tax=Luteimonas panaciterrae TaxID=363885 RepID=UPI001CF94293|nr:DUF3426 domain-containing protein [Luteimonas panaciterrae]
MFINCPQCRALVATDLATGQPPERCPRCSARLREAPESVTAAEATQPDAGTPPPTGQSKATTENPAPKPDTTPNTASQDAALVVTLPGTAPATPPSAPASKSFLHNFSNFLKTPSPGVEAATANAVAADVAETNDEVAGAVTATAVAATSDNETIDDIAPAPEPTQPAQSPPDDDKPAPVAASVPATQPTRGKEAKTQAKSAPSFVRSVDMPGTAQGTHGWKLPAAIAALALLLALQLLLADRNRLAADAGWRPVVAAVCNVLRCSLPPWREPAAFVLIDRDVQAHPKKSGVLRVTATFRNDARWAQPWPRLQLILSDIDGNPVAARVFTVREYLGAAPQQSLLASGQTASIAMDVVEPAARSVAFDFALQ